MLEPGGRGGEGVTSHPWRPRGSPLPSPLQSSDRDSGAGLNLTLASSQSWPAQAEAAVPLGLLVDPGDSQHTRVSVSRLHC